MTRSVGCFVLGVSLIATALVTAVFLAVFYWQPILWVILLPIPVFSLYLGVRLLLVSTDSYRPLIDWLGSVTWVLTWAIVLVEDATVTGFLAAIPFVPS